MKTNFKVEKVRMELIGIVEYTRSCHMSVCPSCHLSVSIRCLSSHLSICPSASGVSLDIIYRCLNRTILYQLSRPMTTVADQTNILDALHKLTSNRSLVFGPGNYDQEFIGCLCYCLLQLAEDPTNIRCVAVAKCQKSIQSESNCFTVNMNVVSSSNTFSNKLNFLNCSNI